MSNAASFSTIVFLRSVVESKSASRRLVTVIVAKIDTTRSAMPIYMCCFVDDENECPAKEGEACDVFETCHRVKSCFIVIKILRSY